MEENLTGQASAKQYIADQKNDGRLYFYGRVEDNNGLGIDNGVVLLFACYGNKIEKLLANTFTDQEGNYLISIPKFFNCSGLLGYKLMAGKSQIPGKAFGYSDICPKENYEEPETVTNNAECSVKKCAEKQDYPNYEVCFNVLEQDKINKEISFNLPAEGHIVKVFNLAEVGESEYRWQSAKQATTSFEFEAALMEPKQKSIYKKECIYSKRELTFDIDITLILLLLGMFGFISCSKIPREINL